MSIQDELLLILRPRIAVQNLSGDYKDLRDSIVEAAREQMRTNISQGARAADIAKEEAVKELDGYFNSHSFYSATGEAAGEAMPILNLLGMRGSTTLVQMVAEQSFFQAF